MAKDVSRRDFVVGGSRAAAALGVLAAMWQPLTAVQAAPMLGGAPLPAAKGSASVSPGFVPTPDLHLLNSISFGVRQADLQRYQQIGRTAYIEEQLNPAGIDDHICDGLLASIPSLTMNNAQLQLNYPNQEQPPNSYTCSRELWKAALIRATYSKRQLLEVMVDFWTNHFNISQDKDDCVWYKTSDDRNVVRAHALGKFRDLLTASAHSPAMLFYLDNFLSTFDNINENYGREIMELHTLGVTGGYTQADVRNVARAFSGWSIDYDNTPPTYEFIFHPEYHDTDPKTVLGHNLAGGRGIEDGNDVLNILLSHPSTAHFIALKLCRHFISDTPPDSLVNAVAATFIATDGDIKAMLRQMLNSTEFVAAAGQKLRTPFHYVPAIVRVMAGDTDGGDDIQYEMDQHGQSLFSFLAPTGYPDVAAAWVSTDGLIARWQYAINLLSGSYTGTTVSVQQWLTYWQPQNSFDVLRRFETLLFGTPMWPLYNERLAAIIGEDPTQWPQTVPLVVATMFCAPEFQLL